jgi:regulatory protein
VKDAPPDSPGELRARALRLLARREHSRAELAGKLALRAPSPEALDALLDSLEQAKQLSNERYAELRARQLARKYGAARIRLDLKSKGVGGELAQKYAAGGELERARLILQKKYRLPPGTREERARRMRFLQSRGFAHDTIRKLLSSDADDEALIP